MNTNSTSTPLMPSVQFYPCNRGTRLPAGFHHYEMNAYGVVCRYCGQVGPSEPLKVTY